jgi:NAD-dependent deacetylase
MKIVVFTGAGVSRESGLLTFRDSEDGLWEGFDVMTVASIQGWWNDPQTVLDFYNARRRDVRKAEPNPAHLALAELEAHHDVTLITQNVDDLHERAGSKNVIHLHGEVFKARPADDAQATLKTDGDWPKFDESRIVTWRDDLNLGDVDKFGFQLRPHIVWFGEGLPEIERAMAIALAPDVDILVVVGTTLNVYPAAMIATETRANQTFVIDPAPPPLNVPSLTIVKQPASIGVRKVVDEILSKYS